MHQAVFADVEIARPGPAAPVIGLAIGDGFLELVETRVVTLLPVAHFEINAAFFVLERLELAVSVMNDADGRGESKLDGTLADDDAHRWDS